VVIVEEKDVRVLKAIDVAKLNRVRFWLYSLRKCMKWYRIRVGYFNQMTMATLFEIFSGETPDKCNGCEVYNLGRKAYVYTGEMIAAKEQGQLGDARTAFEAAKESIKELQAHISEPEVRGEINKKCGWAGSNCPILQSKKLI
jgi:hypothetical protein